MMLDMVAVVEADQVVQRAVMADRASRVLVMAVQGAQRESDRVTGNVHGYEERRRIRGERCPGCKNEHDLKSELACVEAACVRDAVMRQVSRAPPRLRNAEQHAQVRAEEHI